MAVAKTEKSNWLTNVAKKLKATEEEKVKMFQDCALRIYDKNIKMYKQQLANLISAREEEIERDKELFEEAKEDLINASYDIDLKKLDTRATRESQFIDFDDKVSLSLERLEKFESCLKDKEDSYERSKKNLENTIKKLETKRKLIV